MSGGLGRGLGCWGRDEGDVGKGEGWFLVLWVVLGKGPKAGEGEGWGKWYC